MVINLHFPFIITHHTPLFFPEGSVSFSLSLPWGIARARRRSCWKKSVLTFAFKDSCLGEVMLSILGGGGRGGVPSGWEGSRGWTSLFLTSGNTLGKEKKLH